LFAGTSWKLAPAIKKMLGPAGKNNANDANPILLTIVFFFNTILIVSLFLLILVSCQD
jgi:hypothetical protein